MSRIRLRDTGPEIALRRALWALGLRYRLKIKKALPGKPDIVFASAKVAIFVDGCFWHSCPIHGHLPKSREGYWEPKLQRTKQRDAAANAELKSMGWRILRFWEHQVQGDLAFCLAEVATAIAKGRRDKQG